MDRIPIYEWRRDPYIGGDGHTYYENRFITRWAPKPTPCLSEYRFDSLLQSPDIGKGKTRHYVVLSLPPHSLLSSIKQKNVDSPVKKWFIQQKEQKHNVELDCSIQKTDSGTPILSLGYDPRPKEMDDLSPSKGKNVFLCVQVVWSAITRNGDGTIKDRVRYNHSPEFLADDESFYPDCRTMQKEGIVPEQLMTNGWDAWMRIRFLKQYLLTQHDPDTHLPRLSEKYSITSEPSLEDCFCNLRYIETIRDATGGSFSHFPIIREIAIHSWSNCELNIPVASVLDKIHHEVGSIRHRRIKRKLEPEEPWVSQYFKQFIHGFVIDPGFNFTLNPFTSCIGYERLDLNFILLQLGNDRQSVNNYLTYLQLKQKDLQNYGVSQLRFGCSILAPDIANAQNEQEQFDLRKKMQPALVEALECITMSEKITHDIDQIKKKFLEKPSFLSSIKQKCGDILTDDPVEMYPRCKKIIQPQYDWVFTEQSIPLTGEEIIELPESDRDPELPKTLLRMEELENLIRAKCRLGSDAFHIEQYEKVFGDIQTKIQSLDTTWKMLKEKIPSEEGKEPFLELIEQWTLWKQEYSFYQGMFAADINKTLLTPLTERLEQHLKALKPIKDSSSLPFYQKWMQNSLSQYRENIKKIQELQNKWQSNLEKVRSQFLQISSQEQINEFDMTVEQKKKTFDVSIPPVDVNSRITASQLVNNSKKDFEKKGILEIYRKIDPWADEKKKDPAWLQVENVST